MKTFARILAWVLFPFAWLYLQYTKHKRKILPRVLVHVQFLGTRPLLSKHDVTLTWSDGAVVPLRYVGIDWVSTENPDYRIRCGSELYRRIADLHELHVAGIKHPLFSEGHASDR